MFCDPDPDPTGGSNYQKVSEQCLTQCPNDPDPDPTGELALNGLGLRVLGFGNDTGPMGQIFYFCIFISKPKTLTNHTNGPKAQ